MPHYRLSNGKRCYSIKSDLKFLEKTLKLECDNLLILFKEF